MQKSQKNNITQQHIDIYLGYLLVGNHHLFVIFAFLDVSLIDVNLWINCSILHLSNYSSMLHYFRDKTRH